MNTPYVNEHELDEHEVSISKSLATEMNMQIL